MWWAPLICLANAKDERYHHYTDSFVGIDGDFSDFYTMWISSGPPWFLFVAHLAWQQDTFDDESDIRYTHAQSVTFTNCKSQMALAYVWTVVVAGSHIFSCSTFISRRLMAIFTDHSLCCAYYLHRRVFFRVQTAAAGCTMCINNAR